MNQKELAEQISKLQRSVIAADPLFGDVVIKDLKKQIDSIAAIIEAMGEKPEAIKQVKAYELLTDALPYIEENLSKRHIERLCVHIDSYLDKVFEECG